MKKYYLYFTLTGLLVLYVLLLVGQAIAVGQWTIMLFGLYGLGLLGILQLVSGLYLLAEYKHYPKWVGDGVRDYWLLTAGYVLFWLVQVLWAMVPDELTWLWLIAMPLGIAFYQFRLVWRMAGLRRRQLEKRAFLKIYSH